MFHEGYVFKKSVPHCVLEHSTVHRHGLRGCQWGWGLSTRRTLAQGESGSEARGQPWHTATLEVGAELTEQERAEGWEGTHTRRTDVLETKERRISRRFISKIPYF